MRGLVLSMFPFAEPGASSTWSPESRSSASLGGAYEQLRPASAYGLQLYSNAVYYPNWKIYQKHPPSSLRLGYVSHTQGVSEDDLYYKSSRVLTFKDCYRLKPDGTVYLSDEWADDKVSVDETEGCIRAFTQLKPQYKQLKVILSIGGGGEAGSGNFAAVAADPVATQTFVATAKGLVDRFGLDGLDIDWEHPSNPQQGYNYVNLLSQLRELLPSPLYILSSALPAGEWALQNINLNYAQFYLDMINVMCYDFSGPWTACSGHQAQLFSPQSNLYGQPVTGASAHSGIMYMLNSGVPSRKIILGIPVYGRAFPGTTDVGQQPQPFFMQPQVQSTNSSSENSPAQPLDQHSDASAGSPAVLSGKAKEEVQKGEVKEGDTLQPSLEYDYSSLPLPGTQEQHDEALGAAYCVDPGPGGAGFVTYDNPQSVRQKAQFACEMNLGGLFYWHIAADARGDRSLVATGYNALHGF